MLGSSEFRVSNGASACALLGEENAVVEPGGDGADELVKVAFEVVVSTVDEMEMKASGPPVSGGEDVGKVGSVGDWYDGIGGALDEETVGLGGEAAYV